MAAKLKLVRTTERKPASKRATKSSDSGPLKKQREDCLSYFWEQADEGVSWFRSVQARLRMHKNPNLGSMADDFHGARTIGECAVRDAIVKWPALFPHYKVPNTPQDVAERCKELTAQADDVIALLQAVKKALARQDLADAGKHAFELHIRTMDFMLAERCKHLRDAESERMERRNRQKQVIANAR